MIKALALILCIVCFSFSIGYSQYTPIKAKDHLISGSVGFINPESFTFDILGFAGGGNPTPSINLHYEYSITNDIALGAYTSFYRVNANAANSIQDVANTIESGDVDMILSDLGCLILGSCGNATVTERINVFTIGGKLSYHRNIFTDFDTYVSTYVGYAANRRKTITENLLDLISDEVGLGINVPRVVYFTSVGARYFVKEHIGIYGEVGYGNSHILNVGVSYRIQS